MSSIFTIVDAAVDEALKEHPDYLTPKGTESARKMIVRKVASALRDSIAAPKPIAEEVAAAKVAPPSEFFRCECWSKAWWALLINKIKRGGHANLMLDFAMRSQKGTLVAVPAAEGISEDDLATFSSYPSTGEAMKAWRPWFERHGVALPEWRERIWIFLPAPEPPKEESSAA